MPILSILRSTVPELCMTQSNHISITWDGHCAYVVSCDLHPYMHRTRVSSGQS